MGLGGGTFTCARSLPIVAAWLAMVAVKLAITAVWLEITTFWLEMVALRAAIVLEAFTAATVCLAIMVPR